MRSITWVVRPLLGSVLTAVIALGPLAGAEEIKDPSKPIRNVQFQAAEIRSVLNFLADYGGVNVVVAPKVQGNVTIRLTDVLWRDAIDIVASTFDLAVVEEAAGYLHVLPQEDYRKKVSEENKHSQEQRQLTPLETKIVKISNSTSDDIVKAVKSLMTERGQATSDARSNSIILQEVPDNMPKVMSYIQELDKPAKQIKISAQLLEVSSGGLQELGIDWSITGTSNSGGRSVDQSGSVLAERVEDPYGEYTLTTLGNGWTVDAVVQAVISNDKGKIIAHPEVTTIENKEAKIQMGQKVPVKQFDESGNVVIKFEEVGTILVVTPHITAENQILMHLKPERSTYEFDPNGVIINTNNAETNVIVENGQTAVIGGLTTQDEVQTESGIPILKDIPIIGALFKYTQKRNESRDLVIFVTPTIVEPSVAANE